MEERVQLAPVLFVETRTEEPTAWCLTSAGLRQKQLFVETRTEEPVAWGLTSAGLRPKQLFAETRTDERVASPLGDSAGRRPK